MGQHSVLRPHGYSVAQGEGRDQEFDYLQCVHCALQFQVTPLSGKKRGFCTNCKGPTCGKPKCDPCIHWKKKLELIENGLADHSLISTGHAEGLPVTVNVPSLPPSMSEKRSPGGIIVEV